MAGKRKKQSNNDIVFSSTKLSIISKCPRHYYNMYVERIKAPTLFVFAFGIAIHRMLELFYKNNFQSEDSFIKYFSHYWYDIRENKNRRIGLVKVYNEDARNHIFGASLGLGRRILRGFYSRDIERRKQYGERVRSELKKARLLSAKAKKKKEFIKNIPGLFPRVEEHFMIEFNGYKIRGNIDRIDLHDKGIIFFDYKTDKYRAKPTDIVLLKNPGHQFTIYEVALKELFPQYELTGRYLIHLRTLAKNPEANPLIPVMKNAVDFDALALALDNARKLIEKNEFDRDIGGHCRFCTYYEVCSEQVLDEYKKFPDPVFGIPLETDEQIGQLESDIESYWGTDLVEGNN